VVYKPPTLAEFTEATTGFALEQWQHLICKRLERLEHETGARILIHGPPQFGKSVIISQRFPAWLLGVNPTARIRLACYNQTHAERFSRTILDLMQSEQYRQMFPPESHVPARASVEEWSTKARREIVDANPSFKPLGIQGGFTGLGVDTLIIDDPYKSDEEAQSIAVNENIWGWHTNVVIPRLNPHTNMVVMFHRWQEDDYAGKLLAQGGWEYLRFAAMHDEEPDPDGLERTTDGLLTPRYPREYLEDVKTKQGRSFYALYQGRPRAPEGDYFKRHWFEIVPAHPRESTYVRYWDLAAGTSDSADYTAGVLMARDSRGLFYVVDVVHGRWAASDRNNTIKQTAALDKQRYGTVSIVVEQAPGLSKEPTDDIVRQLAGYVVEADRVTKDKESRAQPLQAQAQAGNVKIVNAAWNHAYLTELCDFPTGKHDDQVDASSGAFNKLADSGEGFSLPYDNRQAKRR
jgi:predicted phage terminase large subunit-like protein